MKTPNSFPQISRLRGFSLIELMIVLAVMAILALLAMPNQTASSLKANRAQVAEGQVFMGNAKMGMHMYMQETGECPDNSSEELMEEDEILRNTGIALSTAYSGQYVNSVTLGGEMDEDGGCTIIAEFKPTQAHAMLRGKTLTMELFDVLSGVPKWACYSDVAPEAYLILPKECRHADLQEAAESLLHDDSQPEEKT